MRTTLSLRDDLYEVARQRAFEERRSLGDVVSDLVEVGLARQAVVRPRRLGASRGVFDPDDFDDPALDRESDESVDAPIQP